MKTGRRMIQPYYNLQQAKEENFSIVDAVLSDSWNIFSDNTYQLFVLKVLLKETKISESPIFIWKTNYTQSSREGVRIADHLGPPVH